MAGAKPIRAKERDIIIQALRAGVVPRVGLHHVQVGRALEIEEMVKDVDRINNGGATIRFIIGEYGAGKTFFLHLTRLVAMERKLVVMHADLAPDRRLHATGGQARGLFAELAKSTSTRSKPDGGALKNIVERFISNAHKAAQAEDRGTSEVIEERLESLSELVSGYDFASVLNAYYEGH